MKLIKAFKMQLTLLSVLLLAASCMKKESKLVINTEEASDGDLVEIVSYGDSAILASSRIADGNVVFENLNQGTPMLAQVLLNGKLKAFFVIEPGVATINDSLPYAQGTPLNDKFTGLIEYMDSVEDTGDIAAYYGAAEKFYNENRNNPLHEYFGIEWIKYADPQRVDSFLNNSEKRFREMPRTAKYKRFADLRLKTAPGQQFADFSAEQPDGTTACLSDYVREGKYTLVDFWASWCPYCIKEFPELRDLYSRYKEKGLEIVGVAVRDKAEDTAKAVERFKITWPVMYNAVRKPYDIYGFSGIPHLILIGPDGKIISRGENAKQTAQRIESLLGT